MTALAKMVAKALSGSTGKLLGVKSATLIKTTPGTRTAGAAASGTNPTTASYACKAMIELATVTDVPNAALLQQDDRKIGILGASLRAGIVPGSNDKITIVDIDGVSKSFILVSAINADGVAAMFEFVARR